MITMSRCLGVGLLISIALYCAADDASVSESAAFRVPEPLTLEAALALALEFNPYLEPFAMEMRAADARIVQAGLRPNPELALELEDIRLGKAPRTHSRSTSIAPGAVDWSWDDESGPSGFDELELALSVSQTLETGGKRAARVGVARQEKTAAEWDYAVARADVLSDVARAYVDVLKAQEALVLREDLLELAQRISGDTRIAVDTGKLSPIEATRAESEVSDATRELNQARRELEIARVALAATWGTPAIEVPVAEGHLTVLPALPDRDQLLLMIKENPDVVRAMHEIAVRNAELDSARTMRRPDVTVGLGLKSVRTHDTRDSSIGFGSGGPSYSWGASRYDKDWDHSLIVEMSVPLPIFDRNQGNIAEAEHMVSKAEAEQRASVHFAQAALLEWHVRAQAALEQIEQLDRTALPQVEEIFESIRDGHLAGKFSSLDLYDAERQVVDKRVEHAQALADYHRARVEIERLIGRGLEAWDMKNE